MPLVDLPLGGNAYRFHTYRNDVVVRPTRRPVLTSLRPSWGSHDWVGMLTRRGNQPLNEQVRCDVLRPSRESETMGNTIVLSAEGGAVIGKP